MTKMHKTSDGYFMRCRATVRQGAGVSGCPLEVEGVEVIHVTSFADIALAGGGTFRKSVGEDTYRYTDILDLGDGTYSATTGKLARVCTMDGKVVKRKDRLRALREAGTE